MWHALDKKEVLEKLKTDDKKGLSYEEASLRLKQYGKNELKQLNKPKPFLIFLEQFKSVFILILIVAAIFSFFIKHYIDFAVISAIIVLNSAIGFFQQYHAEEIIAKMKNLLIPKVKVIRNGKISEILSSEIVPGDILIISEGDNIPADCRILHSNNLQTNEAVLTGESFPVDKCSEKISINTILADRKNMLYTGTAAVKGNAKAVVVSTGMQTEFGNIAEKIQKIKPEKTPLEKKIDAFSKRIAVVVLITIFLLIILGLNRGREFVEMILEGVALAVSVIPEGLPAIISVTLALAVQRMQKYNALVRKLPAAETLGRTTVICTDKTGTLTKEEMSVTEIYCNKKFIEEKENLFCVNNKKISLKENPELITLLRTGILCNNAQLNILKNKLEILGDPTEKALVLSAYHAWLIKKTELEKEARIKEYSFSSSRKMMSIVRKNNSGFVSYVKGAPDVIVNRCSKEFVDGKIVFITEKRRAEILEAYEKMASDALRVLAFAYKKVPANFNQEIAENDLVFLGFQGMLDVPREEVKDAIAQCKSAGIKIKMITGDSIITARAIAKMIGLENGAIDGKEIEKLSEKEFEKVVEEKNIFARITPEIKLKIIKILKAHGEIVAVTGDGVNDALALKEAHIGIAMGIRGTDVARDVSDIILLDDNFNTIVQAVREGRRVYDNLKKSIKLQLSANLDELFIVSSSIFFSLPLPFLPLAILWMNLLTDSLPAIALSVEKEEDDIMKRNPINNKDDILNGSAKFILLAGMISFVATIILFLLYYQQDLTKARTMALTASVFSELFIALTCRSEKKNFWKVGLLSNKFMLFAFLSAAVLQIIAIYTPFSSVLGIGAISFWELCLTILVSASAFIFFEIAKAFKIKI